MNIQLDSGDEIDTWRKIGRYLKKKKLCRVEMVNEVTFRGKTLKVKDVLNSTTNIFGTD